ncbi:hypothetical protein B0H16DRAFT_1452115 [Mycena metata]|uniref:F-box domain-containing protein n=1 Tax=Mycena metata TaxID=1033252 RepID=A0AAD7NQG4_9AGAR|nr:hypothetical protein B0H16DRAFT_1452115 [Mycena metata]
MRSWAVKPLFSAVRFRCVEDISLWHTAVDWTPGLETVVRMVTFSVSGGGHAVQYLASFPNMKELHLCEMFRCSIADISQLVGACSRLRALSFKGVYSVKSASDSLLTPQLNLSALKDLTFLHCVSQDKIFPLELLGKSQPNCLRSLTFVGQVHYSLLGIEKLLWFAAPSLVNLTMYATSRVESEIPQVVEMFNHLPAFPVLNTLSIVLDPEQGVVPNDHHAEQLINALDSAPHLTALILRITIFPSRYFRDILRLAFPLCSSGSMKSFLTRRFPLIQRIVFHFCLQTQPPVHLPCGYRRWMEHRLRQRLEEAGEDVTEYLEMEWFDDEFELDPVVYTQTHEKAPWEVETGFSNYDSYEW